MFCVEQLSIARVSATVITSTKSGKKIMIARTSLGYVM